MNRRDFTKSLAALALAPALPALPAAAPATTGFTPYMYGLGAHMARTQGASSPAMLMQKLRLAPEVAQAMQAQLLRQGIITAPNAAGVAMAAQPYMRSVTVASGAASSLGKLARKKAQDWVETHTEPPDDPDKA